MATIMQAKAARRTRLKSALRTTLACSIVGLTSLYGPACLRRLLAYPAFAYVTTVLIVSDATVGDTLRGCWNVLYATTQAVLFSMLSLRMVGPSHFVSPGVAAAAVALGAFLVGLPDSTPLMAKRIAFGQIVIVFVGASIQGVHTQVVEHIAHVALSTALGAFASVLALLFPLPQLACNEIRKACCLYVETGSERLNLYLDAFSAQGRSAAADLLSQAGSLSRIGERLLYNLKEYEEGMLWERPEIRYFKPNYIDMGKRLQETELPLRGMDLTLHSCSSFPIALVDQKLQNTLPRIKAEMKQKLEQAKCFALFDATTAPETWGESIEKSLQAFATIPISHEDLAAHSFLFCLEILRHGHSIKQTMKATEEENSNSNIQGSGQKVQGKCCFLRRSWSRLNMKLDTESLVFALKCSLSLGFAVLFGLTYMKENGYWSGLTIAISFVNGRQPTITVANARAQGTAMGSVYGILCYFFAKSIDLRFLPLLPWIIFTSFLRHSRIYGQAGGISAVIGALLILGRRDYGPPTEFAIARIAEASIGLICFVAVELLFEPARASTLAKVELSLSLRKFGECIEGLVLCSEEKRGPVSVLPNFKEKHVELKTHISKYRELTAEAESEPNFWFLPFPCASYVKIHESLSRMADLISLASFQLESLKQLFLSKGTAWKEIEEPLDAELEHFREMIDASIKFLEEVTLIKSISALDRQLQEKSIVHDVELGKPPTGSENTYLGMDEEEVKKITSSFLYQASEVATRTEEGHEGAEELKSRAVLCIGGLGFCISRLMRETMVIEDAMKEVLKRESPSCHVNLSEISCKLEALSMLA